MLAATGNLQRLLRQVLLWSDLSRHLELNVSYSTFFARPIGITVIYAPAPDRSHPATPETPLVQERQVHLVCSGRTVCVATSKVTLTAALPERLLLDEKYPIGQLFRQMQLVPAFSLINVETKLVEGKRVLERLYKMEVPGIVCEIEEVFPDRDMFIQGAPWLDNEANFSNGNQEGIRSPSPAPGAAKVAMSKKEDLFAHMPHSPTTTPTLSAILEKQAADPVIGKKFLAAYPRLDLPDEYNQITYGDFARLVNEEANTLYDLLSPIINPEGAQPRKEAPTIALLDDSGFYFAIRFMALLKLNVTAFLLAPFVSQSAFPTYELADMLPTEL